MWYAPPLNPGAHGGRNSVTPPTNPKTLTNVNASRVPAFECSWKNLKLGAGPDRHVRGIVWIIPKITIRFEEKHKFHVTTMHDKLCVCLLAFHSLRIYFTTRHPGALFTKNIHIFGFQVYYVLVIYETSLLISPVFFLKPVVSSAMQK